MVKEQSINSEKGEGKVTGIDLAKRVIDVTVPFLFQTSDRQWSLWQPFYMVIHLTYGLSFCMYHFNSANCEYGTINDGSTLSVTLILIKVRSYYKVMELINSSSNKDSNESERCEVVLYNYQLRCISNYQTLIGRHLPQAAVLNNSSSSGTSWMLFGAFAWRNRHTLLNKHTPHKCKYEGEERAGLKVVCCARWKYLGVNYVFKLFRGMSRLSNFGQCCVHIFHL